MILEPLNEPMMEEVSSLFLALGNPARLKILRCLLHSATAINVGAVSSATGLSQANASIQLGILVRSGLITREPRGQAAYFLPVLPLVDELWQMVSGHVASRIRGAYQGIS